MDLQNIQEQLIKKCSIKAVIEHFLRTNRTLLNTFAKLSNTFVRCGGMRTVANLLGFQ